MDKQPNGRHTRTDMGNGSFPSLGWQFASYIRKIQYFDGGSGTWKDPSVLIEHATDGYCYNVDYIFNSSSFWRVHLYFGGPGHGSNCL